MAERSSHEQKALSHEELLAEYPNLASDVRTRQGNTYGNVIVSGRARALRGNVYSDIPTLARIRAHEYGETVVAGNARVQLGDVYGPAEVFWGHGQGLKPRILKWLSSEIQIKKSTQAIDQASEKGWFLNNEGLQSWMTGVGGLFWLSGEPGSGKTTIFSHVVAHLQRERRDVDKIGVAYFYFDYAANSSLDELVRWLIYALVEPMTVIPDPLSKLYTLQSSYGRRPVPTGDIINVLQDIVARFDHTFFLIDGLDEISNDQEYDLLPFIAQLKDWSYSQIHLLVTSRTQNLSFFGAEAEYTTDLSDSSNRLLEEASTYVAQQLDEVSHQSFLPEQWKSAITNKIVFRAHGNFLMVSLLTNAIVQQILSGTPLQKIDALPILQQDVDTFTLYDAIMDRVTQDTKALVSRILQCVAFSFRPFSVLELHDMLRFSDGIECSLERLKSILEGELSLVLVAQPAQGGDTSVQLIHVSFKEYLSTKLKPASGWLPTTDSASHAGLAEICLTYLTLRFQATADCMEIDSFLLDDYASVHWPDHVSAVEAIGGLPDRLVLSAARLLQDDDKRRGWLSLYNPDWPDQRLGSMQLRQHMASGSALYYAARLGLYEVTRQILDEGSNVVQASGRYQTTFHAAALCGQPKILELLATGLEVSDNQGLKHLHTSVDPVPLNTGPNFIADDLEIINQIMHNDQEMGRYGSPAQLAACEGHLEAVQWLLEEGSLVDIGTIHAAVAQGHLEVFDWLWERSSKDKFGVDQYKRTALHKAAMYDKSDMLQYLLKLGFDPNALDVQQSSPLDLAAERHCFVCFDLLLSKEEWRGRGKGYIEDITEQIARLIENRTEIDVKDYEQAEPCFGRQATYVGVLQLKQDVESNAGATIRPNRIFGKHYDLNAWPGSKRHIVIKNLWREQHILRQLTHPNIVQFLGFNYNTELRQAWLYTEYWGKNLSRFTRLKATDPDLGVVDQPEEISLADLWSILVDMASALAFCHHGISRRLDSYAVKAPWREILHRDIKPDNILWMEDEFTHQKVAKLCDLGIARVYDGLGQGFTRGIGTEEFLAPELMRMEDPTVKADVYALGATMKTMNCPQYDPEFEALTDRCINDEASERPSSLEILQIARRRERTLRSMSTVEVALIPKQAHIRQYLLQAFVEVLDRFFRSYKLLKPDQRKAWRGALISLINDTSQEERKACHLGQFLLLAVLLRKQNLLTSTPTFTRAATEPLWNSTGLDIAYVAQKETEDLEQEIADANQELRVAQQDEENGRARAERLTARIRELRHAQVAQPGNQNTMQEIMEVNRALMTAQQDEKRCHDNADLLTEKIGELRQIFEFTNHVLQQSKIEQSSNYQSNS